MINKEELELLRKKATKKIYIGGAITVIAILIVFLITHEFEKAIIPFSIGFFITTIISHRDVSNFKNTYKKTIILELFKTMFKSIKYLPNEGIPKSVLSDTNMIDTGDIFRSEDYVSARYKNVSFEFSDVEIEEEYTDSDGDTRRVTIFKGQWYVFDFNKQFKADLQVCEKGFQNARRGSLFGSNKFNKVQLEDIEFNKEFNVYAQNSLDAFYVLTPKTMENIKELNDKVSGKMLFCFINNKLHVGLHSGKDLFEPNLFKEIDIEQNHKQALEEIKMITHFIDILNLDNDLFRREV